MSDLQRLRCPDCGFVADCDTGEMLRWLQAAGSLRRAKEPDAALIAELFVKMADRFRCPSCDRVGLIAEDATDDWSDEAWGAARKCARCGQPIAPERLEVFPNATLCAKCQGSADSTTDDPQTPEYCPRCGSIMTLRAARTGGVMRYVLNCPQCGRIGS